jgi:hypothetical protein
MTDLTTIVTGSRDGVPVGESSSFVHVAMDRFEREHGRIVHVIQGGCRPLRLGGPRTTDQLAAAWALANERAFSTIPAPWDTWEAHGLKSLRSAGHVRNGWLHELATMLEPRAMNRRCLAFEGGSGTASMTRIALQRGTPVWRYVRGGDGWEWRVEG